MPVRSWVPVHSVLIDVGLNNSNQKYELAAGRNKE